MSESNTVTSRLIGVDVLVVFALSLVALTPFADAYEGFRWLIAGLGGLGIALVAVLLTRRFAFGVWSTAMVVVILLTFLGPPLAIPDFTIGGLIPTPAAWRELFIGIVDAWRNAVTLTPSLGAEHRVLVVPLVTGLIGGLWTFLFLWRSKWPSLGVFGIGAIFVVAAAFGTSEAQFPLLRGIVLSSLLIVYARWRTIRHIQGSWMRRIGLTVGVVGLTAAAAFGVTYAFTSGDSREVLRDHVDPPLEQLEFKSPLSKFRNYYKDHEKATLFRVENVPDGGRMRLATMDEFDGLVWNVATRDQVSSSSAFDRAPRATYSDSFEVNVITAVSGPWVPTIGNTTGASLANDRNRGLVRELVYNRLTGTVAQLGDVAVDDKYVISWSTSSESNDVVTDSFDNSYEFTRPALLLPDLEKLTQKWIAEAGAASDFETVQVIEQQFKKGYFSDGLEDDYPSPSGHSAKRIAELVANPDRMIGNSEQYASAMALALQSMDVPARVVLGFEANAAPELTGGEIDAWVEVKFVESGWVGFAPTPPKDRLPTVIEKDPEPVPQPNVVQPPMIPDEPAAVNGVPPEGASPDLTTKIWAFLLLVLGFIWKGLQIALLLLPIWGILLFKFLRRRSRKMSDDPVVRLSGGWREITDRARDLGVKLPESKTRFENSVILTERYPEVELATLATVADRHVFGPVAPSEAEISAYWEDVETALVRMRKSAPWWRRAFVALSPASVPWRTVREVVGRRARRLLHAVRESTVSQRLAGLWGRVSRKINSRKLGSTPIAEDS